jgi:cytochrome b561
MITPVRQKYTTAAIWLHWIVGILILAQLALGLYMVDIPKNTPDRAWYFNVHKSLGVTIAIFVVLRIWWRATHTPPSLIGIIPDWQVLASKISHWLLYVCIVAMPASGMIMSSYSKYGVKFWGLPLIPGNEVKATRELWVDIHEFIGDALMVLIAIHVLAALKHLLVDKNGVFQRMTPGGAESGSVRRAHESIP